MSLYIKTVIGWGLFLAFARLAGGEAGPEHESGPGIGRRRYSGRLKRAGRG